MYDILGDKYLLKSANSILVVCNKQGEPDTEPTYPAFYVYRQFALFSFGV